MSELKIGTALVRRVCAVCAKDFNAEIVLNTQLTEYNAKKIEHLHQKIVGYLEKPCEDCQSLMERGIVFIGIIENKSTKDNPYRSGHMAVVKREAITNEEILEKGVAYIDYKYGVEIGVFPVGQEEITKEES